MQIDVDKLKAVALDIKALDLTKPHLLIVRVPSDSPHQFVHETALAVRAAAPGCNVVVLPNDTTVDAYEVRPRITSEVRVRAVPTDRDTFSDGPDQLLADLSRPQPSPQ